MFFCCLLLMYALSPALKRRHQFSKLCSNKPRHADNSALNVDLEEQILQDRQLLVGLLDGTVCLHVAGDVEADVIHQGD